jgi:DUF917 family protein
MLTVDDIDALAIGASVLGSGGGGDPEPDIARTKELLTRFGKAMLLPLSSLKDDELVVPVAFMGAPLVSLEKLASGTEFPLVIERVEEHFQKKVGAILPAEIGGSNALAGVPYAAQAKMPLVDADTIGRAFPELQMSSCALAGISPSPAFLADSIGNSAAIFATSPKKLEKMCRALTASCGSCLAVGIYIMTGKEAKQCAVSGTISQAIRIGKVLQKAKHAASFELQKEFGAKLLGHGIIRDVEQDIQNGFLVGKAVIGDFTVDFQNEFLRVRHKEQTISCTPEIIVLIEKESGMVLSVEKLRFGYSVDLLSLNPPAVWTTPQGMSVVGPQSFGY